MKTNPLCAKFKTTIRTYFRNIIIPIGDEKSKTMRLGSKTSHQKFDIFDDSSFWKTKELVYT